MKKGDIPVLFNHKSECCGCAACHDICKVSAISMLPDEEGFSYPNINPDKCVRCLRCLGVCPLKTI